RIEPLFGRPVHQPILEFHCGPPKCRCGLAEDPLSSVVVVEALLLMATSDIHVPLTVASS
ncbi:hypothetical protein A2U01_0055645, partial [Trifolium medium]|nr:hypothetical protein [Trifolium medium]